MAWSGAKRRDPINYRADLVIEFHRRARGGFKSGEKWTVVSREENTVAVSNAGERKFLPLTQAKSFEVFRQEELPLAGGDSVRITKNFRCGPARFTNNELCTVSCWGFPYFSVITTRYEPEAERLLIYFGTGAIVIQGPGVMEFFDDFANQRATGLKADGKEIISVEIDLPRESQP